MKETTDKEALINPGDSANDFFEFEEPHPGHFNPALTATYSHTNAVWLMELCRLVYRRNQIQPSREEFLKRHELHEVKFFDRNQTQAALITAPNFAVLVFRGTLGFADWLSNFDAKPVKWDGEGNVHEGFDNQLSEIWSEISTQLDELKVPAFYTGHSLGAALATLASARRFLQEKTPPAALYTFGSPRAGTTDFMHAFPPDFLHCRVVNDLDIVPTVPPRTLNFGSLLPSYHHVGTLHHIEHNGHLRRGKPNDGEESVIGLFQQAVKGLKQLGTELETHIKGISISLPEQFTDHAPVNYSARIERAGDFN